MISSLRKKKRYRAVRLLFVLILGLLWHPGQFIQGPPFVPGEAYAADDSPPALVRKKLPTTPPAAAPAAEPLPAPAAPVSEPPKPVDEKPPGTAPPEPVPAARAAMPELGPAPSPSPAPPAKTEPPKPEIKPLSGPRGVYPFSILLSSCKEKQNAVAALSDYRKAGLTPYIVETDLGSKGLWWRILAGHYRTLDEAAQARKALRSSDAVVVKTPYANLIGQYASEKEAFQAADHVTPKEVFPYVVRGPGNSFQLMAGAFPSQKGAEKHQRELESKGISTRTIQR